MRQEQPTSDFNRSDWAILAGLFVLLGFVMALAIHLGYLTELFQAAQAAVQKVQTHVVTARNP
jgi:fatty acid desaturase